VLLKFNAYPCNFALFFLHAGGCNEFKFGSFAMKLSLRRSSFLVLVVFALFAVSVPAHAQVTESVLYSFCSQTSCADGSFPSGVVIGTDGNLYGLAEEGGTNNKGAFFQLTPAGKYTVLYSFCSQTGCPDGTYLQNGLLVAPGNTFYGTTLQGGDNNNGTLFKITSAGALTTLYTFCSAGGSCLDGSSPEGGVILGSDDNLYGTTGAGGTNAGGEPGGGGTVFQFNLSTSKLTTIYNFCSQASCADGIHPNGLLQGNDSALYGTTQDGGGSLESGTIFRVTTGGDFTSLASLCPTGSSCTDGEQTFATLLEDGSGNFFGTALEGGNSSSAGTIFEYTSTGTLDTLYSFCPATGCADGEFPFSGLTKGSDGNYYGTTDSGGANSRGEFYEITPAGVYTALYGFCGEGGSACTDGNGPTAPPAAAANGVFYGTTQGGGANNSGTVYKIVTGASTTSTTTTFDAAPNPATVGVPVKLTATVSGASGTPTGTVNFTVNGTVVGTGTLSDGVATATVATNGIAPATYPVVANYLGNSTYNKSSSTVLDVVLNKAPTTTTLSASPSSVTPPAKVTLTATVIRSASEAGKATGTVTFYYGDTDLGSATLNTSGVATLTQSSSGIPAGTYAINARYNGDTYDSSSVSSAVNVMVE
jgi:uncharacterized repeat protein (TIGR03803 family)